MKYVLAVSGGVDSVALLDMVVKRGLDIVVAHFDHGIRPDSMADERFVRALTNRYGVPYETKREELGAQAGEALARERRYAFLRAVAWRYSAEIMTAHHLDDLVETIAINCIRGTGWRGLAVLDASDIRRPLLRYKKKELYDYALKHRLEWVEDETNMTDAYLRNRVRRRTGQNNDHVSHRLLMLRKLQRELKKSIQEECRNLMVDSTSYKRYFFIMIDEPVAMELLRFILMSHGIESTRPALRRLLMDIKVRKAGAVSQVIPGASVSFTSNTFVVKPL